MFKPDAAIFRIDGVSKFLHNTSNQSANNTESC